MTDRSDRSRTARAAVGAALLISGMVTTGSAAAGLGAQVGIQPHRGLYDLRLGSSAPGSNLSAARGAMVYEWSDSCDNWTVQQQARFDLYDVGGDRIRTDVSFSSWEAKDGTGYGFSLRTRQDGMLVEDVRGTVAPDAEGDLVARYVEPEALQRKLEDEVDFPVEHTLTLIRMGRDGKRFQRGPLFLGQRVDEPMQVSAVVSERVEKRPVRLESGSQEALDTPSWNVQLAYYAPDRELTPDFEIVERLHENGIVSSAEVYYDDFSLRYDLRHLELLPPPAC